MKKLLIIASCLALLSGCTNPDKAHKVLEQNGYKNIQMDGYSWFGCGEDYFYHDSFYADALNGDRVHGAVCSGMLFKGASVKLD